MEKYYWCGICGGKATSGTAACGKCRYFVHLKCTKVTFKEAKKLGRKFICIKCKVWTVFIRT